MPPKSDSLQRASAVNEAIGCIEGGVQHYMDGDDHGHVDDLRRVELGDADALRRVIDLFAPLVFRVAFRITRSEADAEDVAQRVFIALPEVLNQFDGDEFESWLTVVTARRVLMFLRRERRVQDHDRYPVRRTSLEEQVLSRVTVSRALGHIDRKLAEAAREAPDAPEVSVPVWPTRCCGAGWWAVCRKARGAKLRHRAPRRCFDGSSTPRRSSYTLRMPLAGKSLQTKHALRLDGALVAIDQQPRRLVVDGHAPTILHGVRLVGSSPQWVRTAVTDHRPARDVTYDAVRARSIRLPHERSSVLGDMLGTFCCLPRSGGRASDLRPSGSRRPLVRSLAEPESPFTIRQPSNAAEGPGTTRGRRGAAGRRPTGL